MQAGDVKLGQVFSNDHVNVIPLFQRPYVWDEEDNWKPLWHDVAAAALEVEADRRSGAQEPSDSTYFLGAVVIHQRLKHPQRLASSHIIDGQQRMTTLQVLLAAMRSVAVARGQDKTGAQCTALLENRDEVLDDDFPQDRHKVWPLPQDRTAFLWAVRRPDEAAAPPDDNHRLVRARRWFEAQITAWIDEEGAEPTRLQDILTALKDRMQLVQINLGTSDHPQVIFEALNHRGVRLAAADLVKNRLFYAVESQGNGKEAERLLLDHWLILDNEYWRSSVTTGRIKRALVDLLISYWLTVKIQDEVIVESLFSDFSRWMSRTDERSVDIIRDLRRYADIYARILNSTPTTPTGRLVSTMRATNTNTPWPALLALHATPGVATGQLEKASLAIDSYLMRRGVGGLTTKDYNRVFIGVLKAVLAASPDDAGDAVANTLAAHTADSRYWPSDKEFAEALAGPGVYDRMHRARLKALLVVMENHLRSDMVVGNNLLDVGDSSLNIEHVMPQKWKTNWPLAREDDETAAANRERAISRLGNLTLATTKLNPTMSNKAWSEKRPLLQSHSLVRLTSASLLASPATSDLSDAEWTSNWDEVRIEARTKLLADLASELWPGPPGVPVDDHA
jgi:hypothetical protein